MAEARMGECTKTLLMQQMLQSRRMLGDGDNACQAAVMRPEDQVGFIDGMLYTAKLIGIISIIYNGFLTS
jgi:hypothetical protein